jgi:hypothetical protein
LRVVARIVTVAIYALLRVRVTRRHCFSRGGKLRTMIVGVTGTLESVLTQHNELSAGRGRRVLSPFRQALLMRGHGEWAFHADGKHVRVAREAPLQLSSLSFESPAR